MDLRQYFSRPDAPTQRDIARAIGVKDALISQWATGVRRVPAEHCPAIEAATGGAVRCETLRPDVNWAYLRSTQPSPLRRPRRHPGANTESLIVDPAPQDESAPGAVARIG